MQVSLTMDKRVMTVSDPLWEAKRQRDRSWLLSWLSRGIVLAALSYLVYLIADHVTETLTRQNISTGFDFLSRPSRIQIGESLIPFEPTDTYSRFIFVAILNTLQVGVIGCVLATILGIVIGVMRLTDNPILRRLSGIYVETFRNTPLLLQLFFWYAAIQFLPPVRQSFSLFGSVFLSQRGAQIPALRFDDPYLLTLAMLALAIAAIAFARRLFPEEGDRPLRFAVIAAPLALFCIALATGVLAVTLDTPKLIGFGYQGGVTITPELMALLAGLIIYTASFIAEIVRGGIQAIPAAQTEASESLGLTKAQTLRLVTLPQTVRIIVPPLVSQYLNLVKNSSLAVAIGYPDVVWATNAVINQTGQAIEGVLILAGIYLTISLLTSFIINWLNERGGMQTSAAGVAQTKKSQSGPGSGPFIPRMIAQLFSSPTQSVISVVSILVSGWIAVKLFRWGVMDAVWVGKSADCRAVSGACWAYVWDKLNFFLFGLYPQDELWRPELATITVIAVAAMTMMPRFWGRFLPLIWAGGAAIYLLLMGGGFGLSTVQTTSWGGLPVTLLLAFSSIVIALPISILLAVGRNSKSPAANMIATGWIEIIRGVPLISILFLANTLLPLFLAGGSSVDKLLRAQIALTIFASAYLAEAVRAGLRAVPCAQIEAAQSIGLSQLQMLRLIILPQALRTALPGIVNTAIGNFKDTTLVSIVGLFDVLGTVRAAGRDPTWLGFEIEGYLFAALIYFTFCFIMSRYGAWLERRGPKTSPQPEPA